MYNKFLRSHHSREIDRGFEVSEDPFNNILASEQFILAQIEKAEFVERPTIENFYEEYKSTRIEVEELKAALEELVGKKRPLTQADYIYNRFKKELERDHRGKIIAIDIDRGCIAGIGDTVDDTYEQAVKETGKEQFAFKRVGFSYLDRV